MSSILLYVDEDAVEHAVVRGLRARNIDVLTTLEADRIGSDDLSQLEFAASMGRAIYTFNVRDFVQLHTQFLYDQRTHAGILIIPDQRCSIGEKIRRLAGFISRTSTDEIVNRIEFL